MKREDVVARLRELQADAYGAEARATRIGERLMFEHGHDGRANFELGSMQWLARDLARRLDALVQDLSRAKPAELPVSIRRPGAA